MRLLIVIVNYRTAGLVVDCLRSLRAEVAALPGARVVVTDNQSPDDSVARLRAVIDSEGMGGWATLMPLERNGGFAYGNNAAIRGALAGSDKPELVMLLNPDTVVHAGAVGELVRFMQDHPEVGIAGGRVEEPGGNPQVSAHWLPSALGEFEEMSRCGPVSRALRRFATSRGVMAEPHACEWVSGASMMIRRSVFERIGLLDEGFFLYFEEVDFCRRAVEAGFHVWYVPASRIVHFEGSSTGITVAKKRRPAYWYDSRRRYFFKRGGVLGLLTADAMWLAGRMLMLMRRSVGLGGSTAQDPARFARDLLLGDLRAVFTGRVFRIDRGVRPA